MHAKPFDTPAGRASLALVGLLIFACGDGPAASTSASQSSASAGAERTTGPTPEPPPPLPQPVTGRFSLPLRIPLDALARRIDAELPVREASDWQTLTAAGHSPALEARYTFWRDPVKLRFADSTLHFEVPLRYAASFNARVKNPFGGKWFTLAKDEPWGTRKSPQRLTLHIRTRVKIGRDWKLELHTAVERPRHGAVPGGKLCTRGSFKLCVTKSSLAPQVRKALEAELMPRMQELATRFDRDTVQRVELRGRIERGWAALQSPVALPEHDRFLRVAPTAAALDLRSDADAILIEPAVHATVTYSEGPPETTPNVLPLPERTPLESLPGEPRELPAGLLPFDVHALLDALLAGVDS